MSITTAASGLRVITPAKSTILDGARTAGSAAQLGTQTGGSNQVIVPNAIGTNNEGNLMSSPSYVGRHFMLRPLATLAEGGGIASGATIAAGGTGYTNGAQTLTLSGGTHPTGNEATVDVNVVGGVVATITGINYHGNYTVTPADAVATTGGGGTGCTLNMTWVDGEEIRFIAADASNTLDVHEDWDNDPVSGEDWAISYIPEDCATLTGCTKSTKTGVFEFSRRLYIGDDAATAFAFYGMAEGKAMEIDDVGAGVAGFVSTDGGVFIAGYPLGGVSINGGFFIGINNTAAENLMQFDDGSRSYFHDCVVMSYLADLNIATTPGATFAVEMRACKFFQGTDDFDLGGWLVRDSTIAAGAAGTNLLVIDEGTDVDGLVLINTQGFDSADDATTRVFTLKNVTFAGNVRHVRVHDDHTWRFVNPVGWVGNSTLISFEVDDLNEVQRLLSVALAIIDVTATAIADALIMIFEGTVNDAFPADNIQISTASGAANSDVLVDRYTFPSSVFTTETFGGFALRAFKYGYTPFVAPAAITNDFAAALTLTADLGASAGIGNAYDALKNVSTVPTIERHGGSGDTDSAPMLLLAYDGGNGTSPTVGEIFEETSGLAAGATVVAHEGDGTTGVVLLDAHNGIAFNDNDVCDGLTSGHQSSAHITGGTYLEYSWEVDAGGNSMTLLYDWLAAMMAQRLHPSVTIDDGGVLSDYSDEAKSLTADDTLLMPATPATNDAVMFGDANALPTKITIDLSTAMTTSTVAVEYWNGAWTALSGVTDGTSAFTASTGVHEITYTYPTDAVLFFGVAFIVRVRQTHATPAGTARATRVWTDRAFEKAHLWGRGEQAQLMYSSPAGFSSERTVDDFLEGVYVHNRGGGFITHFTSDDGTQYVPAVSTEITLSRMRDNTEVRVLDNTTKEELAGIEVATAGSADERTFAFTLTAGVVVDIILINKQYKYFPQRGYTIPASDVTIERRAPIDPNYYNPP